MPEDGYEAALISTLAVPSKAAVLAALMSGRALPASELAYRASITQQTASFHLKQLLNDGFVRVRNVGRHRYFELSDDRVAMVLERVSLLSSTLRERNTLGHASGLRCARMCYDHIAGQLGVAIYQSIRSHGYIRPDAKEFEHLVVSPEGRKFFTKLGVDLAACKSSRRKFAFDCIDWSERTPHLAGALGASLAKAFEEKGWIERNTSDRSLVVTTKAYRALPRVLGLNLRLVLSKLDVASMPTSKRVRH
jgi:DNA-binding transcriptional ArsR family regulator